MDDFNNWIIDLEVLLAANSQDKKLLINETFVIWYILVEGISCENFAEQEIKELLIRNIRIYQRVFTNDADFNFIIGWMLTIAFWYFEPLLNEADGIRLLKEAYRSNPKNSLFMWSLRKPLTLTENRIEELKIDIASRFDQFYNYSNFLQKYFLDVI